MPGKKAANPRPQAPKKLSEQSWSMRNKQLQGQRRKVLGNHYAAKYRVR